MSKAVVFHDQHPDSQKAAQQVARYCNDLGIDYRAVQVDAFDIVESAAAMQEAIRKDDPRDVLFNVSGGTKVLSSAAVLASILEGLRAVYIHEETGEERPLPLFRARYEDFLTERKREILRYVAEHDGCTQRQVYEALNLSKPTVNGHIKGLVEYGLLEQAKDENDTRVKRLHVIPAARLLFQDVEGP